MRVVVQRVRRASVTVADEVVTRIGPGLLVLLGIAPEDGTELPLTVTLWLAHDASAGIGADHSERAVA